MPAFISGPLLDKETGVQQKDVNGIPRTEQWTDPDQHKTRVRDTVYDGLMRSFTTSKFIRSDPFTDPETNDIYIMTEGNLTNGEDNEPERGKYVGPIITKISKDEAQIEQSHKKSTTEDILNRLKDIEADRKSDKATIASLTQELAAKNAPVVDLSKDLEKEVNEFVALDARAHARRVRSGKADNILKLLAADERISPKTKIAIKARLAEKANG